MGLNPVKIVSNAIDTLINGAALEDIRTGFNFGYVIELLDTSRSLGGIKDAEVIDTHVFVLNPSSYSLSEPFTATLTPAEDNTVNREENGIIMRTITIEGTHGVKTKRVTGFEGKQSAGAVSGHAHFLHLRNMFRLYSDFKQGRVNRKKRIKGFSHVDPANVTMVFHSLREDDHFIVVPQSFETPRDRQSRNHYRYRITMTAVGETSREPKEDQGFFGKFDNALQDINEAFDRGRAFFVELNAAVDSIKDRVRDIEQTFNNVAQTLNEVSKFVRNTSTFIPLTLDAVQSSINQLEAAGRNFERAVITNPTADDLKNLHRFRQTANALSQITMYPDKFGSNPSASVQRRYQGEQNLTQQDLERNTAGAGIGSRTRIRSTQGRVGINVDPGDSFASENVKATDSLEAIAQRYGTTPEAIIIANDLRPPYIAPGGGPGILAPGDPIIVPTRAVTLVDSTSPQKRDYLTAEDALYGVDLALTQDDGRFDIDVDSAHGSTAAALSRGTDNVIQGLEIILGTERGETRYVPTTGIRRTAGIKAGLHSTVMASIVLREGILSDPRVESIAESTVRLEGDVLYQDIVPVLSSQKLGATIRTPFGKATGKGT